MYSTSTIKEVRLSWLGIVGNGGPVAWRARPLISILEYFNQRVYTVEMNTREKSMKIIIVTLNEIRNQIEMICGYHYLIRRALNIIKCHISCRYSRPRSSREGFVLKN